MENVENTISEPLDCESFRDAPSFWDAPKTPYKLAPSAFVFKSSELKIGSAVPAMTTALVVV